MAFLKNFIETGSEIKESISLLEHKDQRIGYTGMGADGTLTSTLDKLAEDYIIERIKDLDLPFNIISEESGFIDRGYEKNIVIDPLDGTYNAENQLPFYSMSLAIMENDFQSLEEALVMNLATGNYFWGAKGQGAYRNGTKLSNSDKRTGASVVYKLSDTKIPDFLMEGIYRKRILGCASLEMSMIANGSLDHVAYLGEGKQLRNVDIAAGVLLIKETGGFILEASYRNLNMGKDVRIRENMIALSAIYTEKVKEFGIK
jgi:fructose-1,6-bisphosphatase/inositol monophosphatase family enzyme